MKKILSIGMIMLLSMTVNAQLNRKFNYELARSGSYFVTPVFDQTKGIGNRGQATWTDENYANNLFYNVVKEVLPEEKILKLHLKSTFIIVFNSDGEILNSRFLIDSLDLKILTEEDLLSIVRKFKKLKIDMTKVRINSGSDISDKKVFDYTEILGPIIPLEYRVKKTSR